MSGTSRVKLSQPGRSLPPAGVTRLTAAIGVVRRGWRASRLSRLLFAWGPAVGLMAAIYFASDRSDAPGLLGGVPDVLAHAAAYAVLGAATLRGLAGARRTGATARAAVLAAVLAAAYGAADEFHQSFVPGRSAELRDVLADALGAAAGAGLGWAWSVFPAVRSRRGAE